VEAASEGRDGRTLARMRRALTLLSAVALLVAVPATGALALGAAGGATGGGAGAAPARAGQPSTTSGLTPVHVRPGTGGPRSAFAVSLRIPAQTGTFGQFRRSDELSATGPSGSGCVSHVTMVLPAAPAGSTVRLRLVPGHSPAHWCAGTFHGKIMESQTVVCGANPKIACPMVMIRPQMIGRFRFAVR
jgi:hypothetical protein